MKIECQSFSCFERERSRLCGDHGDEDGNAWLSVDENYAADTGCFLPKTEAFEFAEERRLFYVALTRAKHRAYVITDMTDGPFVTELLTKRLPN